MVTGGEIPRLVDINKELMKLKKISDLDYNFTKEQLNDLLVKTEIKLIEKIDEDLKLLWKEQGIRPHDSLRQEIENILGFK